MSNKNVAKNYIFNLMYQTLVVILPFITIPYVSRIFGAEGIGVYGYALSISAYFIMGGSLGVNLYAQKEIAYLQEQERKRSILFWECLLLKIITMSISLVIFYSTFATFNEYNTYFKILSLELIAHMIDISWFFQGLEEFKKTVVRNILIKLISLACIFIFVKTKNDLNIYFIIYVISIFLANVSLWFYLFKYLSNRINIKRINIVRHLKPTLILFIPQIATQINAVLDKTMLGSIANNMAEVGYYDQSNKIIRILLAIITAMGVAMLPRMSNFFANNEHKKINDYIIKSANNVYFLGIPIVFGMVTISDKFVPVFFGNGYNKVVILIKLLSPIVILIGLSNVLGVQYLLPTKKQNFYTISVVAGTVCKVILNLILIPKLFSIGSEISTVIAEFVILTLQVFFVRKELDIKTMLLKFKNYLIGGLLILASGYLIEQLIKNNVLCIIVQVIIGVIVYCATLFILRDNFFFYVINKIMGMTGKAFKINKKQYKHAKKRTRRGLIAPNKV